MLLSCQTPNNALGWWTKLGRSSLWVWAESAKLWELKGKKTNAKRKTESSEK